MIKLLIGITLSEMGGSQRVVYDIIANLAEYEYDITLVTSPGGELLKWIDNLNVNRNLKVKVITVPSLVRDISFINDFRTFFHLFKILRKGRYDVAHFHNSKIGIMGRVAAWIAGVPKIFYTVHGWGLNACKSTLLYRLTSMMEWVAGQLCTKVVFVAESDMEKGMKSGLTPKGKACLIYNGISNMPEDKYELRKEYEIPENIPVLASIARLSEPKDPLFTIRLADRIRNAGLDFRLLLIGDGSLRKDCERMIEELKIDKHVLLLGMRADVRKIIHDIDIVLLFSKWEGLPISVIEAMFAGKPVVASNVGGIKELIDHGKNGYLLDDFHMESGVAYISDLIHDAKLRETMGMTGRSMACSRFTLDRMVRQYHELYKSHE